MKVWYMHEENDRIRGVLEMQVINLDQSLNLERISKHTPYSFKLIDTGLRLKLIKAVRFCKLHFRCLEIKTQTRSRKTKS